MGKKKNKMATHAVEATGLRVISMYVQEYFHWGWQSYEHANDDGIDGEIIPRTPDGQDMGVRIKVQSKSGPGYYRSENNDYIVIQPYNKKKKLIDHLDSWKRQNEPVILVYTNAEKRNAKGNSYLDLKNPKAWWVQMNKYVHDGSSQLKLPKKNLFQEHTKGELVKMIKPFVKDWVHYPELTPDEADLIFMTPFQSYTREDVKAYYSAWKAESPTVFIGEREHPLLVSRVGWRHITDKARRERVDRSLSMLPIAKRILEQSQNIRPVVLRSRTLKTHWDSMMIHLGYRARVIINGREEKVQVVVKWYKNLRDKKEKVWFYSVHIIK